MNMEPALKQIKALVDEWNTNSLGGVGLQRQRWQKLGRIASEALWKKGLPIPTGADFERIKTTDPIVLKVLAAGGTLEDVIVALVRHAEEARALFKDMEIQSTKLMPLPTYLIPGGWRHNARRP
jgi:hypothetical protein